MTVYYIHNGCTQGGQSAIEGHDEHIEANLFTEGDLIPNSSKCICGEDMILMNEERSASLRDAARSRNAERRKEWGKFI